MARPLIGKSSTANKYRQLRILINGAVADGELTMDTVALAMGMSESSARKYLQSPELLSLDKLCGFAKALEIAPEALHSALPTW